MTVKKQKNKKYKRQPYRMDIGKAKPINCPAPADPGKGNQKSSQNTSKKPNRYSVGSEWNCGGARWPVCGARVSVVSFNKKKRIVLVKDATGKMSYIPVKYLKKTK